MNLKSAYSAGTFPYPLSSYTQTGGITGGFTGEKYPGGLEYYIDNIYNEIDTQTIRAHSRRQYNQNTIAHALIEAKIASVIGRGLKLEATPAFDIIERTIPYTIADRIDWERSIELLFELWAQGYNASYDRSSNFYEIQRQAYRSYLLDGKAIAVLQREGNRYAEQGRLSQLSIQLINKDRVASHLFYGIESGRQHRIINGMAINARGAIVGYYINPPDRDARGVYEATYIPRWGRNGRTIVIDLTNRRHPDDIEGYPELTHVLQDLQNIEKYRQNEIVSSQVNAGIALYSSNPKAPGTGGALAGIGEKVAIGKDATGKMHYQYRAVAPGIHAVEAFGGETTTSFDTKRPNVNFQMFVDAVVKNISASLGTPVEILEKKFSTSYSASRAALIEWWRTVETDRRTFGTRFCTEVYREWLNNMASKEDNVLEGWNYPDSYKRNICRAAYSRSRWIGPPRGIIDPLKEAKGYEIAEDRAWTTAQQIALNTYDTDFHDNAERRKAEREANAPPQITPPPVDNNNNNIDNDVEEEDE